MGLSTVTVKICKKVSCFQTNSKLKLSHALERNCISSVFYSPIFLQSFWKSMISKWSNLSGDSTYVVAERNVLLTLEAHSW